MPQLLCPLATECKIFKGQTPILQPHLQIYQNVFCRRGLKGWSNCEHYQKTKKSTQ